MITTGVMAHEDAGVDFTGTKLAWMESWAFIGILAVLFVIFWILDSTGRNKLIRPGGRAMEAQASYIALCAIAGALLFAGTLADSGHNGLPGLFAGALVGFIGYLGFGLLFMRANQRLFASGDPGVLLGLGRDVLTIGLSVVCVLLDVVGYAVLIAALVLAFTARRREGEKYEGLRILR